MYFHWLTWYDHIRKFGCVRQVKENFGKFYEIYCRICHSTSHCEITKRLVKKWQRYGSGKVFGLCHFWRRTMITHCHAENSIVVSVSENNDNWPLIIAVMNNDTMTCCLMHKWHVKVKGQGHNAMTFVKNLGPVASIIIIIMTQSWSLNVKNEMFYNFLIGFIHLICHFHLLIRPTH